MNFKSSLRILWAISFFGISALAGCTVADGWKTTENGATLDSPTPVVVRILNLDLAQIAQPTEPEPVTIYTPTVVSVLQPTKTPITIDPSRSSDEPTITPSCINRAEFVKHLNISDNTALEAGQFFSKIWQIRNAGTCQWNTGYALRFFSGDQMNGPAQIELSQTVNPGETVDIQVNLTAPNGISSSAGNWVMSDPFGNLFGFGEDGDKPVSVIIQIKPTPKPTPG